MDEPNIKKRKLNELSIDIPLFLYCQVCNNPVYDYKCCVGNYIYCSYNCYSVLYLRNINNKMQFE